MPAYISHSIMAENLYNDYKSDNKIFKIPINVNDFKTFSLGHDLATISKHLKSNPHITYTKKFHLEMIKYIKENNLIENSEIMSLLYGHITHYFFDISAHPFIFYYDKGCRSVGLVSNHRLIEGFLDSYLSDKILHKDIMEINEEYFNKANLNNLEIKKILNTIYGNIYGDSNIIKTYKKTLHLFSFIEKVVKSGIFSKEDLIKIVKFKEFLELININEIDLSNEENNFYTNPCNGVVSNLSFLEMYYLSINKSLDAINEVNKCLYNNHNIANLNKIFKNLAYDTGVHCGKDRKLIYVRNYK